MFATVALGRMSGGIFYYCLIDKHSLGACRLGPMPSLTADTIDADAAKEPCT
jgi:hypothetical protein